jgi:hypothetical protein
LQKEQRIGRRLSHQRYSFSISSSLSFPDVGFNGTIRQSRAFLPQVQPPPPRFVDGNACISATSRIYFVAEGSGSKRMIVEGAENTA